MVGGSDSRETGTNNQDIDMVFSTHSSIVIVVLFSSIVGLKFVPNQRSRARPKNEIGCRLASLGLYDVIAVKLDGKGVFWERNLCPNQCVGIRLP